MLKFEKRKQDVLSKEDKSSKQSWDDKIIDLCDKINKKKNYYTTSSCSGRVVLIEDREKKGPGMFHWISHGIISLEKLKHELGKIRKGDVKFKQEPCILHVACVGLKDAEALLKKAQLAGWKRSGIISSKNGFICELLSTEKLEFPIMKDGKLLVGDDFLRVIVEKANENLEKSWEKIEKLSELMK